MPVEMWQKILMAVLLGTILITFIPRTRQAMQDSPRAGRGDWKAVVIPILVVVVFVLLLISSVRH